MRILSFYLLKEHVVPFIQGIAILTFIFILDFIIDIMDMIIAKGLSAGIVLQIFALNLAWMVALSVPMAVLVATLMAFGRLSGDNEITALKAVGVSLYRMIFPILLAALGLAGLLVLFNNYVLPESNHRARMLMSDVYQKRPTLQIEEGVFLDDFPGYSLLINKIDEKSSNIYGVTIYVLKDRKVPQTILADQGRLSFSDDGNTLTLTLIDGEIHEVDEEDPQRYRRLTFKKHVLNIEGVGSKLERRASDHRGDREMNIAMMKENVKRYEEEIQKAREGINRALREEPARLWASDGHRRSEGLRPETTGGVVGRVLAQERMFLSRLQTERRKMENSRRWMNKYLVEIHKKFSIPAACLVFVLIGVPLAVRTRRGGGAIAFGLSLGFFLLYWAFLIGGEGLADRGIISPFWAMWSPNFLIGGAGVHLLRRTVRETKFISWEVFRRLLLRRFRD